MTPHRGNNILLGLKSWLVTGEQIYRNALLSFAINLSRACLKIILFNSLVYSMFSVETSYLACSERFLVLKCLTIKCVCVEGVRLSTLDKHIIFSSSNIFPLYFHYISICGSWLKYFDSFCTIYKRNCAIGGC